ncbi:hypothetical protein HYY74_03900 [Candidatus Woesearchaeota archaeon]|nr:hypothetical protein [Candidatus Woesearchaeota archaeon]
MQKTQPEFVVSAVIEIAGAPKKHVEDTMRLVDERLKAEEGMKVTECEIHEAEEHEGIFSTFAEAEIELDSFESLMLLCFEYMPSSIEFLEPEKASFDMLRLTRMFNDLLGRLHESDRKLKQANAANIILEKNSHALLKGMLTLILKDGSEGIEAISRQVGIAAGQLKPFLEQYEREKVIRKEGGKYALWTRQS